MARDAITHHRKLKGLSQGSLGKLINLDAQSISRIERGYRDVSPAEASAMSTALGVSLVELGLAKQAPVAMTEVGATEERQKVPENDLTAPRNFKLMPDENLLRIADGGDIRAVHDLTEAIKFAEKILHTSKVPAATWIAWRDFHRKGTMVLRSK